MIALHTSARLGSSSPVYPAFARGISFAPRASVAGRNMDFKGMGGGPLPHDSGIEHQKACPPSFFALQSAPSADLYTAFTPPMGGTSFRFAHYQTDQLIRQAYRAAEIADGGRYGTICKAAFPDGLGPVVAPYGTRQIPPTEALVDRITKSKLPEMGGYRSEWLPKIEASLASLKAAADELKVARDAYLDAYRAEFALRSEHYRMLDKIMCLVRAAFPDDRAKQDLIFPDVEDDDAAAEAETEEAGQGDGG